jgi:hypothetical protein
MSLDRRELPRVIVVVEGVVVVGVHSDTEINLDILDHDNADGQSEEDRAYDKALAEELNGRIYRVSFSG